MGRYAVVLALALVAIAVATCIAAQQTVYRSIPTNATEYLQLIEATSGTNTTYVRGLVAVEGSTTYFVFPSGFVPSYLLGLNGIVIEGNLIVVNGTPVIHAIQVLGRRLWAVLNYSNGVIYVFTNGTVLAYNTTGVKVTPVTPPIPSIFMHFGSSRLAPEIEELLPLKQSLQLVANISGGKLVVAPSIVGNASEILLNQSYPAPIVVEGASGSVTLAYVSIYLGNNGYGEAPLLIVNGTPITFIEVGNSTYRVIPVGLAGKYAVALLANASSARLALVGERGIVIVPVTLNISEYSYVEVGEAFNGSRALVLVYYGYEKPEMLTILVDFGGGEPRFAYASFEVNASNVLKALAMINAVPWIEPSPIPLTFTSFSPVLKPITITITIGTSTSITLIPPVSVPRMSLTTLSPITSVRVLETSISITFPPPTTSSSPTVINPTTSAASTTSTILTILRPHTYTPVSVASLIPMNISITVVVGSASPSYTVYGSTLGIGFAWWLALLLLLLIALGIALSRRGASLSVY